VERQEYATLAAACQGNRMSRHCMSFGDVLQALGDTASTWLCSFSQMLDSKLVFTCDRNRNLQGAAATCWMENTILGHCTLR